MNCGFLLHVLYNRNQNLKWVYKPYAFGNTVYKHLYAYANAASVLDIIAFDF